MFAFIYAGNIWGITVLLAAAAFFALTVLFKRLQEDGEKSKSDEKSKFIAAEQTDENDQGQSGDDKK